VVSDPEYISDEELVRLADNVFVGRVIKRVGYEPPSENTPPLPQTLFSVKVERNIKGSLSGTVSSSRMAAATHATTVSCW
jgi:hypothetical protein